MGSHPRAKVSTGHFTCPSPQLCRPMVVSLARNFLRSSLEDANNCRQVRTGFWRREVGANMTHRCKYCCHPWHKLADNRDQHGETISAVLHKLYAQVCLNERRRWADLFRGNGLYLCTSRPFYHCDGFGRSSTTTDARGSSFASLRPPRAIICLVLINCVLVATTAPTLFCKRRHNSDTSPVIMHDDDFRHP